MQTTFTLGGYTVRISSDVPRLAGDTRAVGFQIDTVPMRLPNDPEPEWSACGSSHDQPVPPGTRILMSTTLRHSEARAIASALLSAATEARASA